MKILGICGSPRSNGNTDILLEKALEGARGSGAETEKLFLEEMNISPCSGPECDNIGDDGLSIVGDDIRVVFAKMWEADAVIVASPIFFGSLSAQTKMMIDRFQCVWLARNRLGKDLFPEKKKGAFICVQASSRQDFFDNAVSIIRHFFATVRLEYAAEVLCMAVDVKGSVLARQDVLDRAFEMGKKMALNDKE